MKLRRHTKPIITAIITLDCNASYIAFPLAVFEKGISDAILFPFTTLVFAKGDRNTIVFYLPTRLSGVSDRSKLMRTFDMWSATSLVEKTLICCVNAFQFFLDRLTWQRLPMRMRSLLEFVKCAAIAL